MTPPKGILPDLFTLAQGRWILVTHGGNTEVVESDGTKIVDMKNYKTVMAMPLKKP